MLLFLLLSFGTATAYDKMADKVYDCSLNAARKVSKVTAEEIVDACKDQFSAKGVSVDRATSDGDTQFITLSWTENGQKNSRNYIFNTKTGKPCSSYEKINSIKSLNVDLQIFLNQIGNTYGDFTCKQKFGFKLKSGKCERACGQGQSLMTTMLPMALSDYSLHLLSHPCKFCPANRSAKFSAYTQTHPDSNSCFDRNGCEETKTEFNPLSQKCVYSCPENQVLDNNTGHCKPDPKKNCEYLQLVKKNLHHIANKTLSLLDQGMTLGTCDSTQLRSDIQNWVSSAEARWSSTDCSTVDLSYKADQSNLYDYFMSRHPSRCWAVKDISHPIDLNIYYLFQQNILSTEDPLENL